MCRILFWITAGVLAFPAAVADGQQRGRGMGMHRGMHGGMRMGGFQPLPVDIDSALNPSTPAKVELGRLLYFETRLSGSGKISCNSCHDLAAYGVDNEPTSDGDKGQKGARNSPTVLNAAGHFAQFWDGRAATVEEQAKGPMLAAVEMAMASAADAEAAIRAVPEYNARFRAAFPGEREPVTFDNIAKAIGAFERKLTTHSPWDRFLEGDATALTAEERAGLHRFMHTGCVGCHNGTLVGGNSFQRLGAAAPYPDQSDPGRFRVTGVASDRMVFKVPSLRNVEKTAPYFHNGQVATLEDAVGRMARYQLDVKLSPEETRSIIAWLKTLTGTLPDCAGAASPKLSR